MISSRRRSYQLWTIAAALAGRQQPHVSVHGFASLRNRQPSSRSTPRQSSSLDMVRNIDLAEAVIFYGKESLFADAESTEWLPGVERLLDECQGDDTAVLAILEEDGDSQIQDLSQRLSSSPIVFRRQTQPPPNPRDLWEAIHSIDVQPKGFGGSSGFGSKAADPERPPLPKHCVVLCHTEDQCRAARFAGMRVLCLTDNALADAVILEGDWDGIYVDDIATPGSFWLNPPHPRDDESNAVDPESVILAYETSLDGGEKRVSTVTDKEDELTDAQLAAMLSDIDSL